MEAWDEHYIDLVVPGYIEIEPGLQGSFQFGTVSGDIDARLRKIGDTMFVEWSWWGESDTDDGCGRGWAHIENQELIGRIFIHGSDDSSFIAERFPAKSISARGPRTRSRPRTN
jgi:hypothetical protein